MKLIYDKIAHVTSMNPKKEFWILEKYLKRGKQNFLEKTGIM